MVVVERPYDPNTEAADEARTLHLIGQYGLCPGSTAPPGRPSPAGVAAWLWRDQVHLPAPEPYVAPGWAIVGKWAYLESRAAPAFRPAPLGAFGDTFTITATVTGFDVDWGDGQTTHTTDPGGPWPDGRVRHAYANAGTYHLRVIAHWRGTYSVNGSPPAAVPGPELRTEGTFDLPAREVQAVRD